MLNRYCFVGSDYSPTIIATVDARYGSSALRRSAEVEGADEQ